MTIISVASKFIPEPGDMRIVHIYENLSDYVDHVSKNRDKSDMGASGRDYGGLGREGGMPWNGTSTFQEAVQLATHGWAEARPSVDAVLNPLREALAEKLSIVAERAHDITGHEPDIDRFLAGELECMYDDPFVEAPANGRVYRLLVSGAVNSGVSPETLKARGIAIVALVEAFQMVGSEVEIWMEDSYKPGWGDNPKGWKSFTTLVRIHAAGEVLDIDSIMFPLAHPAWFRRFSFAECESLPTDVRKAFGFHSGSGYGQAADLRVNDLVDPTFTLTKGGEGRQSAKMDDDPLGFILETLKGQGAFDEDADHWGD